MDCAFAPDVGEGGVGVDIHDAPDGICRVAKHIVRERAADGGMSAIAALVMVSLIREHC